MEIRIVIFLAFVSVTVVTNTLVLLLTYRLFARMASKVTETVSEVRTNSDLREWIDSMQVAAERAALLTESAKLKFAEFDPVLGQTHENYRRALLTADSKLGQAAESISKGAQDVRNMVAKPAFSVATFAAGVTRVLEEYEGEE